MTSHVNANKLPHTHTLNVSLDTATHLSPCSYGVHKLAQTRKTEKGKSLVNALLYVAKPIDRVIQAVSLPIITAIDHCRDIHREKGGMKALKILATPLSLPLKLVGALFVSAVMVVDGAIQTVVPYQTIHAVRKGRVANNEYFAFQARKDYPDSLHLADQASCKKYSSLSPGDQTKNRSGEMYVW